MRHRSNKQNENIKKILAVLGAFILALSGVAKLTKDNASEKHAAVVSANERYTSYLTQSTISLQILLNQVRAANGEIDTINATPVPQRDYSKMIEEYVRDADQFHADLNRNYDELSKLIDALPPGYAELRQARDDASPPIKANDAEIDEFLRGQGNNPVRFEGAKNLAGKTVLLDMDAIRLGDKAMTAADETIRKQEERIKLLGWSLDVLVPLGAVLAIVAAFWRVKVEGSD